MNEGWYNGTKQVGCSGCPKRSPAISCIVLFTLLQEKGGWVNITYWE
jgi:hypothetical protein